MAELWTVELASGSHVRAIMVQASSKEEAVKVAVSKAPGWQHRPNDAVYKTQQTTDRRAKDAGQVTHNTGARIMKALATKETPSKTEAAPRVTKAQRIAASKARREARWAGGTDRRTRLHAALDTVADRKAASYNPDPRLSELREKLNEPRNGTPRERSLWLKEYREREYSLQNPKKVKDGEAHLSTTLHYGTAQAHSDIPAKPNASGAVNCVKCNSWFKKAAQTTDRRARLHAALDRAMDGRARDAGQVYNLSYTMNGTTAFQVSAGQFTNWARKNKKEIGGFGARLKALQEFTGDPRIKDWSMDDADWQAAGAKDAVVTYHYATPPKKKQAYSVLNPEDLKKMTGPGGSELHKAKDSKVPCPVCKGKEGKKSCKQCRGAGWIEAPGEFAKDAELSIGDKVHLGFGKKGGAGYEGVIIDISEGRVTIRKPDGNLSRGLAGMVSKPGGSELHKAKDADVRIVYNKLLGGWYVVRGPHQTPLGGRYNSKEEAQQWLARGKDDSPFDRDTDTGAAKIIKREAAAGKTALQIKKDYGFSLKFIEEVMASKKAKDGSKELSLKNIQKNCKHTWVEVDAEPPYDVCNSCGLVRY